MQRQTTWMVSILTLMVVLSAYYLMTGDVNNMKAVTSETNEGQVETIELSGELQGENAVLGEHSGEAVVGEGAATSENGQATDLTLGASNISDFFDKYRLDRNNFRLIQIEKLYEIISDSKNSTAEQIVEAQTKIEEMTSLEYTETVIEELLAADYGDAVVMSEGNHVKVVVNAKELTSEQVVQIINMVTEQMSIPATMVSVSGVPQS
jgi:stage III sporulation protein AH